MTENEIMKNKILTELYNSGQLQTKLIGIMSRHRIPMNAEIQNDIIQTTFEHLTLYNIDKMIDAYNQNPKRILALGVTIMLRKCILKDCRYGNPKHSLSEYMLFGSPLKNTNQSINQTDSFDDCMVIPSIEIEEDNNDIDYNEMWNYVISKLNSKDVIIVKQLLKNEKVSFKIKKEINKKIKDIINFKNN